MNSTSNQRDLAVVRGPGAIVLLIFGIFFLVGCLPIGIALIILAGMLMANGRSVVKAQRAEDEAKAYQQWDRERILAAKSLRH